MRKRVTSCIFSVDVGVDHVVGEHAALGQELAVLVEVVERLVERWQTVGIFASSSGGRSYRSLSIGSPGWILFWTPSRPAISSAAKREVRVRRRIREAHLDAAALRVGHVRNADRRRAVARRVGQLDRRFEARHQALVASWCRGW